MENAVEPKIIKTDEQHKTYLAEVERLAAEDPALGTTDGDRLELLAKLVEDYEKGHFKSEIIFVVEEAPEGGLAARAIGESIFTQAATAAELHGQVRDAVRCHFAAGTQPKLIRLHFVRDEVIAA